MELLRLAAVVVPILLLAVGCGLLATYLAKGDRRD